MIKRFFIIIIRGYSYIISPFLGHNCRYTPTCSRYAQDAIERHGAIKGLILATARILRCHPWSKYPHKDPVPNRFTWRYVLGYKRSIQKIEDEQI